MFYKLHKDTNIGYKKITDAELGMTDGGTTHIGLLKNTLEFIPNYHQEASAQLIYNNSIIQVIDFLDPIENPDGSLRSPKIRTGKKYELARYQDGRTSVVNNIRKIANDNPNNDWFLFWFGLDDKELIFILINKNSDNYFELLRLLGPLKARDTITRTSPVFIKIIEYLTLKVNNLNIKYFEELELNTQTEDKYFSERINPKKYDIIKAQNLFQKIGRKGEEIVNEHLNRLVHSREIQSFQWMNKNSESGYPFDFEIQPTVGSTIYSDAKATSYRFEQKMIFSSQELQFINENRNYMVHRVFNINDIPQLRVCNNIANITDNFMNNYRHFNDAIRQDDIFVNSMKISVPPTNRILNFYDAVI